MAQEPVAKLTEGEMRERSKGGCIVSIENEASDLISSYGMSGSARNAFSGRSAKVIWAAMRSSAFSAAIFASSSPDRKGVALAKSVFKSAKWKTRLPNSSLIPAHRTKHSAGSRTRDILQPRPAFPQKMRHSLFFPLVLLAACVVQGQTATGYRISVIDGEGALNNVVTKASREPVIQVTDANHKPISGAYVEFDRPVPGRVPSSETAALILPPQQTPMV